ncbi:MAG: AAA family ATPase, partial [Gemmatimonadota bacterium]
MYQLNPEYQIRSLGGVTLLDAAGEVIQLRSRKHLALLIYLVSKGSRVHTRSELASLLWSSKPARARHSLSQAVYDLRTQVGAGFIASVGEEIRVDTRGFSYDANELEEAVKSGDYSRAVDLYAGPFGSNLATLGSEDYERWIESERVRLDRLAHLTLHKYAEQCAEEGRWGEMCVVSTRLLELEPLNEAAHRSLMRGLQLQGDGAAALSHFASVREELDRELPDGICEETLNLVRRIEATLKRANGTDIALREPPFVGRAKELDRLDELARTLSSATPPAVYVCGPAGIGKTRLVHEFMAGASAYPIRFVESRCYPAETNVPYGPIVDGLEKLAEEVARTVASQSSADRPPLTHLAYLFPKLSHLIPPQSSEGVDPAAWRRRLFDDIADVLKESLRTSPIIWVVEDTHWIDGTSEAVLGHLSRRLKDEALLIVQTTRENLTSTGSLPKFVSQQRQPDQEAIALHSLSTAEVHELLGSIGADLSREQIAKATALAAGHPFYALEIVRAGGAIECQRSASSEAPNSSALRAILAQHFDGLSELSLDVARATAVLGRQASPYRIATLTGLTAEETAKASRELYMRLLLVDDGTTVGFTHQLLAGFVIEGTNSLDRAALHLKAAELLGGEKTKNPTMLARHFRLGGDRARAFRLAMSAADLASNRGSNREAADLYSLA